VQVKVRGAAKGGKGAEARAKKRNQKIQQSSALDSKREKLDKQKVCEYVSSFVCLSLVLIPHSSAQVADSMKRYSYLLGQTELFKHFVDAEVSI
jgi:SWI/SNF-related matrix-associated actin-dependent regulator of chromatin subfamily A member 5